MKRFLFGAIVGAAVMAWWERWNRCVIRDLQLMTSCGATWMNEVQCPLDPENIHRCGEMMTVLLSPGMRSHVHQCACGQVFGKLAP